MSSSDDIEIENTPETGTYERKPKHVKRLNFGQSILNLNTVQKPNIFSNNKIVINKNVAQIPITEKEDFVRKWIETHNCDTDLSSNGSNQSSPILGVSKFKQTETSPVLGVSTYQKRIRSKLSNNETKKEIYKQVEMSPILGSLNRKNRRRLYLSAEKKRPKIRTDDCVSLQRSPLLENSRINNLQNVNVERSPILVRDAHCYKRRRIRTSSENDKEHKLNTATIETNDCIDGNMNLLLPRNVSRDINPLSPEIISSTTKKRIRRSRNRRIHDRKKNTIVCSPLSSIMEEENVIVKDYLNDKTNHVIESVSSDDNSSKENKEITDVNSNCDESIHDIIEDIDTQETVPMTKTIIPKAVNKCNVASSKDSDETFYSKVESYRNKTLSEVKNTKAMASPNGSDKTIFSKAESIPFTSSVLSDNYSLDRISEVTAISNDSMNTRSSQTNFVISNVTSPVRTNSWPTMSLQLIDSCKKKRRIKKKSLAGKLQSLINKQTSFIRIWHHQMKQADADGTSMPHVVVYVDKCTVHLYRQFLEGIVLDDPFNLLNSNNESNNKCKSSELSSQKSNTKLLNKMITMIIIPDIVGKIEMKQESIVKIYPPWDIMDESKTILNITYIKIMPNEQRNLILSKVTIPNRKKEKELIKEFHCPCFEADKILSVCKEIPNNEKPDTMEELFKF